MPGKGDPLFTGGRGNRKTVAKAKTGAAKTKTTPATRPTAKRTKTVSTDAAVQLRQLRAFIIKRGHLPNGHRDAWLDALDEAIGDTDRDRSDI